MTIQSICAAILIVLFCPRASAQWVATGGPYGGEVKSFAISPAAGGLWSPNIFAGIGDGGIFRSTDDRASWTAVNSGLTSLDVLSLAVNGTNLFAGTWFGCSRSTDNGATWTGINPPSATSPEVSSLAVSGANLLAGYRNGTVFLSSDNGVRWTTASTGLTSSPVSALAFSGTNLFAGTGNGGVFLSTNNNTSWTGASANSSKK